jgi:hypothetical protein
VRQKVVPNVVQPDAEVKTVLLAPNQIPPMAIVGMTRQLLKEDPEPPDAFTVQLEKELHLFIETYHVVLPNRNAPGTNAVPGNAGPAGIGSP